MSEVCPLCGEPFRGILDRQDTIAYMRTNARFSICGIGDGEYHTIHTDPEEEWLEPPEYVFDRTLESTDYASLGDSNE